MTLPHDHRRHRERQHQCRWSHHLASPAISQCPRHGLLDSGGNEDLTQGYHVEDIQNIVLSQSNGVPVKVKDVADVWVGACRGWAPCRARPENDVVAAIVVMNRTLHTHDVALPGQARDRENQHRRDAAAWRLVSVLFYDRTMLVSVNTRTVLHNLIFGCILVFLIQWIFLGNLRSAIIVGINIPFALFFSIIILVLRGEDANLLSIGAVDFGIIVDSAVILVENIFRNFQGNPAARQRIVHDLAEGRYGEDPTRGDEGARFGPTACGSSLPAPCRWTRPSSFPLRSR